MDKIFSISYIAWKICYYAFYSIFLEAFTYNSFLSKYDLTTDTVPYRLNQV